MARHLRITVEGRVYDVIVEEVEEDGLATPSPHAVPRSSVPPAQPKAEHVPAGPTAERAPLGGLIIEVAVSLGDRVSAGDRVVVIEAMKMKSIIKAHADGVVTNVAVHVGDVVDSGQPLVTIG
jgi:glutaconyl-CoA/methylmalonyl-CoA decarboxylase subunit gamma